MQRSAGILLHPSSLPSRHGIGDIGPAAHDYIRWLSQCGATWWQILPLCPPGPGFSPYSGLSTFAGSPWLLSPEALVQDDLLTAGDIGLPPAFSERSLDIGRMSEWKNSLLRISWNRFRGKADRKLYEAFEVFKAQDGWWLEDFGLFAALKDRFRGKSWLEWSSPLARREDVALVEAGKELEDEVAFHQYCQFLFFRQWSRLKAVAEDLGVSILGDLPIFVSMDSADVWAHPELFRLDDNRRPTVVAGVPPDYFSETGQLWGNPLYDWECHAENGYSWWIARTLHALDMMDAVRLDHFRGFAAFWEVPAGDPTAVNGRWVSGPGRALFDALQGAIGSLPMVAEDLGEITPDVEELRRNLGLPGMAVLHFGFSPEPRSDFIPYRLQRDTVVYTGTHDNNTTVGWYAEDASEGERDLVRRYTASDGSDIHWQLIRQAMASVANVAIIPHQDLLGLDSKARMNRPGEAEGNWTFRVTETMLDSSVADRFRDLVEIFARSPETQAR